MFCAQTSFTVVSTFIHLLFMATTPSLRNTALGARKMARQLRAFVGLLEAWSSLPNTEARWFSPACSFTCRSSHALLWPSQVLATSGTHTTRLKTSRKTDRQTDRAFVTHAAMYNTNLLSSHSFRPPDPFKSPIEKERPGG